MQTIFNDTDYLELMKRAEAMQPDSQRHWGTMDAAQMMAHVNTTIETGLGTILLPSESNFFLRVLIKPLAIGKRPMTKNAPTAKSFRVTGPKEFSAEKQKLLQNLKAAHGNGLNGNWQPHISFGPLTPEEWGGLIYKHVSHHLNQFSC